MEEARKYLISKISLQEKDTEQIIINLCSERVEQKNESIKKENEDGEYTLPKPTKDGEDGEAEKEEEEHIEEEEIPSSPKKSTTKKKAVPKKKATPKKATAKKTAAKSTRKRKVKEEPMLDLMEEEDVPAAAKKSKSSKKVKEEKEEEEDNTNADQIDDSNVEMEELSKPTSTLWGRKKK